MKFRDLQVPKEYCLANQVWEIVSVCCLSYSFASHSSNLKKEYELNVNIITGQKSIKTEVVTYTSFIQMQSLGIVLLIYFLMHFKYIATIPYMELDMVFYLVLYNKKIPTLLNTFSDIHNHKISFFGVLLIKILLSPMFINWAIF